jgi:predicted Zn-dependent protease
MMAGLMAGLTGCATVYNPATHKNEIILISSAEEVQIGRGMSENIIKKDYRPLNDAARQLFVNRVGQRVARVSDRKEIIYRFMVLDDPDFNAFALPGGYIYITSGLLDHIDESQLAAVWAHEVAHVAAKHSVKKMQSALGYNLLAGIALAGFGDKNPALAKEIAGLSGTVYNLLSLGYGRQDELFADKLAVDYLRRAGVDPYALVRVLEFLNKENGPGGRVFEILSTHPRMQERIRKVQEEIQHSQTVL